MHEFKHISRRVWDVDKEEMVSKEVLEGAPSKVMFSPILQDVTYKYVLTNTNIMAP
jgi:hypothetical protein